MRKGLPYEGTQVVGKRDDFFGDTVTKPDPNFIDNRQRGMVNFFADDTLRNHSPGIYKDPIMLAAQASVMTAEESPNLKRLFGVDRGDLAEIAKRKGNRPGTFHQAAKPKGAASAKKVMTPENAERMVRALTAAERHAPELTRGMQGWYVLDPLVEKFKDVLGKDQGLKDYDTFNSFTAMNSPGAPVDWEIPRGSAAFQAYKQGFFDDWERYGGINQGRPEHLGWNFPGHPYHSTAHGGPIRKFIEHGDIMSKEPKVPLYRQASQAPELGFQTDTPVPDAHWSRAVGLADVRTPKSRTAQGQSASGPEMTDLGKWWREEVADQVGIEAVPAQARAWGLFAPQTGVETKIGAPKLELIADAVAMTAKRLNITPEEALERVIRGETYAGE
jgi:hypothetical protein